MMGNIMRVILAIVAAMASPERAAATEPAALPGGSIYQLDSVWTDQDGRKVPLPSLRGRPRVIAMVYTSCEYSCPLVLRDLDRIDARIPSARRPEVAISVFSFDPERDTPEALKKLATKKKLDLSRWSLLTAEPDSVLELGAALGVRFRKESTGEFSHSNVILLLDGEGMIRSRVDGLGADPAPILEELARLKPIPPPGSAGSP